MASKVPEVFRRDYDTNDWAVKRGAMQMLLEALEKSRGAEGTMSAEELVEHVLLTEKMKKKIKCVSEEDLTSYEKGLKACADAIVGKGEQLPPKIMESLNLVRLQLKYAKKRKARLEYRKRRLQDLEEAQLRENCIFPHVDDEGERTKSWVDPKTKEIVRAKERPEGIYTPAVHFWELNVLDPKAISEGEPQHFNAVEWKTHGFDDDNFNGRRLGGTIPATNNMPIYTVWLAERQEDGTIAYVEFLVPRKHVCPLNPHLSTVFADGTMERCCVEVIKTVRVTVRISPGRVGETESYNDGVYRVQFFNSGYEEPSETAYLHYWEIKPYARDLVQAGMYLTRFVKVQPDYPHDFGGGAYANRVIINPRKPEEGAIVEVLLCSLYKGVDQGTFYYPEPEVSEILPMLYNAECAENLLRDRVHRDDALPRQCMFALFEGGVGSKEDRAEKIERRQNRCSGFINHMNARHPGDKAWRKFLRPEFVLRLRILAKASDEWWVKMTNLCAESFQSPTTQWGDALRTVKALRSLCSVTFTEHAEAMKTHAANATQANPNLKTTMREVHGNLPAVVEEFRSMRAAFGDNPVLVEAAREIGINLFGDGDSKSDDSGSERRWDDDINKPQPHKKKGGKKWKKKRRKKRNDHNQKGGSGSGLLVDTIDIKPDGKSEAGDEKPELADEDEDEDVCMVDTGNPFAVFAEQ